MEKITIKQLLREGLLNETFFDPEKTSFKQLIKCTEDLLNNFNDILSNKYKLGFFKQEFRKCLSSFKSTNSKGNSTSIKELKNKYDNDLLNKLNILELLEDINKTKDTEKVISKYLDNLNKDIDSTFKLYKDKYNKDKKYNVLTGIESSNTMTYKNFMKDLYFLQLELLKLQEWVVANDKKILILFEGRDAAGKGSNVAHFSEHLNPKHLRVETFGVPTEEEKKDWFKRYKKVLPKKGEIVLYDRSWYNRAVVEPAMGYCTEAQYNAFMKDVGEFEDYLINKKDIMLFKVWIDVSKEKQELRFELRKHNPLRYWKFSKNDEKIIKNWNKLTPYIDKLFKKTNFPFSKWIRVNGDNKFDGTLNMLQTILSSIDYNNKNLKFNIDKVIFLDLHGVVIKTNDGNHDCNKEWDNEAVKYLNQITDATGAKIVMLSACKDRTPYQELIDNLKKAGVTGEVIDKTISLDKHLRAEQVKDWLGKHKVKNFLIIDDKPYNAQYHYRDNFLKVDPETNLVKSDVEKAIKMLK